MIKRILTCTPLLMLMFCNVYAEWQPDFTPQCGRDEKVRNKYLKNEKASVEHSLTEMKKRGINIIPTPKNLFFTGKDIAFDVKGDRRITIFAGSSADVAVDMIIRHLNSAVERKKINDGISKDEISIVLLRKDENAGNPLLSKNIPDFYQGYTIETHNKNGKRTYVLTGKDYTGLLYAAVTFCKLIKSTEGNITFPGIAVSDWPDIRYRHSGSLMYPYRQNFRYTKSKSTQSAKKFIDWLLEHKINMLSSTWGDTKQPHTNEEKKWLKEICKYAKARGIYVEYLTMTGVGFCQTKQEDAIYKDCIKHLGIYYCWSNSDLIKKRAQKMVQYLKDTGLSSIYIHSMDTTNSKWHDRCKKCREQFGDDRFTADAYVFNKYRDEIRKSFPDIPITIVPRPYHHSMDDIRHIKRGDMKSKDDLKNFSEMLAEDIYVCHRETDRTASLTWVNTFRQPMNTCVMAWYLTPWLIGRDITPIFRYFRTYNYPLSNEIASLSGVHSGSRDKMQCLGFAEYSWNLNAPGSAEYAETPEEYKQI
jgi:glycosyl hydrolase family 20